MNVNQLSGSLGLLDLIARQTAGILQQRPARLHREPKSERVNGAAEKEKSGSSTEKGPETSGKGGRTRVA